jgi:thiamine pyrophosphate-dependent acetolactate synthase large subunit-like protein
MGELTTAVKYGMDITHVLLRNDPLGKIPKEQRAETWQVWQTSLHNPSFSDYARICGAKGFPAAARDDRDAALEETLGRAGPSLAEIVAHPELI